MRQLCRTCDTHGMKSSTRVTKGKIVVEAGSALAPADFPLKDWIPGRRRLPSQERSQRTRRQILAAAEVLAKSEGIGSITMQMIAAKAKIAAGTAYQFFDDRDAIFAEIYESWAREYWERLMHGSAVPWTEESWEVLQRNLINQMGKFYLATFSRWEIVRYVESTKAGRSAMRQLLNANVARYVSWAGPLFRSRGYSAAETEAICTVLVRTARGHYVYGVSTSLEMRELNNAAWEGMNAIVRVKLGSSNRPRSAGGGMRSSKSA